MSLDIAKIREDFPILSQKVNGKDLVYFDNAATSQKPKTMIEKLVEYYEKYNSNIHRGVHTLSQKATEEYENVRKLIAKLYGCDAEEVIFTKSDTESLNLLAYSLGRKVLEENPNANILITDAEHHSNIVPWQALRSSAQSVRSLGEGGQNPNSTMRQFNNASIPNGGTNFPKGNSYLHQQVDKLTSKQANNKLRFVQFSEEGLFDLNSLKDLIDENTEIFSFTWASNTFGIVYPLKEIVAETRRLNPKIKIIVDAAQYVPHAKFDFRNLDIDFITFSAHKVFGPTGIGVLIGKKDLLEEMPPFLRGGDMIKEVDWLETTYNDLPYKFEAGTPNIADVIAFGASLNYLEEIGWKEIQEQEEKLAKYLLEKLSELDFVEIYGPIVIPAKAGIQGETKNSIVENWIPSQAGNDTAYYKLPLITFNLKGIHAHDVGTILDEEGIAVRTGHHCTQLIMKRLKIPASVRASLAFYNTKEEIDKLIFALKKVKDIFYN